MMTDAERLAGIREEVEWMRLSGRTSFENAYADRAWLLSKLDERTLGRCKDCRHFGAEIVEDARLDTDAPVPTGFHACQFIEHVNGDDRKSSVSGSHYDAYTKNAGVEDGSGYHGILVVRDDFGCVNFEESK